ncbi:uncharacterized protein LOC125279773 isoform X2 [Megalobrama amblycephala]|uniref:uncharacterized protein LOC125279773 isoform X2 n=1 Tax=Megalobrama amblycephala TaxID=75352 RepID=UPI002013D867|nr:uncharacterized protein LOC125279773 isoform X2 [Megalobrama amblycephala]
MVFVKEESEEDMSEPEPWRIKHEEQGGFTVKSHSGPLLVSGSSRSIFASVGEDVTLSCSVDSHITPEHIEEVSWKKTDDILVLLYQNNKTLSDSSDERYRDRVEFFTYEIPKGNFSLRLKSVRTKDKGVYMCQVFAGGLSANATVVLEQLGFSVSHIMVLILCISGSALLLCCLIYCRSPDNVVHLQMFLVFCPNILMFLAFVLWGVSEGSLNETVFCCVHYLLRPLMLLYAAPYAHDFTGSIGLWIQRYTHRTQYTVFSAVFFAVIFKYVLDKGLNYTGLDGYMVTVLFVIVLLLYLYYIFSLCAKFVGILCEKGFEMFSAVAGISCNILPSFQFILLYYTFGTTRGVFFIVAVLPLFLTITNYSFDYTCGTQMGCSPLVARSVWVVFMFLANSVMVYLYTVWTISKSLQSACRIMIRIACQTALTAEIT